MATCPNCGNQTTENAVFCDQCGTRVPRPEAAAPAPAPAGGSVICPVCGAGNVPGEAFCEVCGSPLEHPLPQAAPAPAAAPAAPEAAAPSAGPTTAAAPTCPSCGAEVLPGEAFCANCGASLAQPPIPPEPVAEVTPPPPGPEPIVPAAPPQPVPEAAAPPAAPGEALIVPAPSAPEPVPQPEPAPAPEPVPAPVPEPVPAPAPEPAPVIAPSAAASCPVCGTPADPGDTFCSNCGAALKAVPEPAPAPAPAPAVQPAAGPAPAGPRLVVQASGAEIPLPSGAELLIGREDPVSGIFPEVDLTPHGGEEGGVSRRHARILFENGQYFVEDLDSTNYTFVNKQKLAPRTHQPLRDGDELRFGRVGMMLLLH